MDDEADQRKQHRKRHSGPKAEKKKSKEKHEQELTARQRNPKAFAYHSVNKVAKAVRRYASISNSCIHSNRFIQYHLSIMFILKTLP